MDKITLKDSAVEGFFNLLKGAEDRTLNLMADQAVNFDHASLQQIEKLAENSKDEEVIDSWYFITKQSLRKQIEDWKKGDRDLETGLFLLSKIKNPGIDETKYKAILDNYAKRVQDNLKPDMTEDSTIKAINEVLFNEENFMGNQISYYDLNNNFIHTVLKGKAGNPIMLSSIYILVARRLGLEISGVGTPGHFVIKYGDKLLDPFFGGREITKDECVLRAQELSVFWRDEYLEPIADEMMISRCIRNLIAIYKKQNDLEKAADASALLKAI